MSETILDYGLLPEKNEKNLIGLTIRRIESATCFITRTLILDSHSSVRVVTRHLISPSFAFNETYCRGAPSISNTSSRYIGEYRSSENRTPDNFEKGRQEPSGCRRWRLRHRGVESGIYAEKSRKVDTSSKCASHTVDITALLEW